MDEKNCDGCEDRRKDKWKVWKEIGVSLAVAAIMGVTGFVALNITTIRENLAGMGVDISWLKCTQQNQTQAISNLNNKIDEVQVKVGTLKIALDEHMHQKVSQRKIDSRFSMKGGPRL
jgi:uncharacterized membrane protein